MRNLEQPRVFNNRLIINGVLLSGQSIAEDEPTFKRLRTALEADQIHCLDLPHGAENSLGLNNSHEALGWGLLLRWH